MFIDITDLCSPTQPGGFICPSTEVLVTEFVIWGVIDPARQFSNYYRLLFLLIGALLPATWGRSLKWPNSFLRYVFGLSSSTELVSSLLRLPSTTSPSPYYVLSAALDSGVAISIVVIFFWYIPLIPDHLRPPFQLKIS